MDRWKLVAIVGLATALLFASLLVVMAAQPPNGSSHQNDNAPQDVQSPSKILFGYQGRLLKKNGNPINNNAVDMVFELFPQKTGGSQCWKEKHAGANAISVNDGIFQVTLGQLTPIDVSCSTANAYLQLTVNGEVLSPREHLLSVATAVEAMNLSDGAKLHGSMSIDGSITAAQGNGAIYLRNDYGTVRGASAGSTLFFIDSANDTTTDYFRILADNSALIPPAKTLFNVYESGDGSISRNFTIGGHNLNMESSSGEHVVLRYDENRWLHLLPWGGNGYRWDGVCIGCGQAANLLVRGNMQVTGTCNSSVQTTEGVAALEDDSCAGGSLTTGAVVEANLQTPEELQAEQIERFSRGDLLCWEPDQQRLKLCDKANDRLVMAVADMNGKPIIVGAEPVKVLGPLVAGDILVSASLPGYAAVNNNPLPGTVIGQALQGLSGQSGMVKAMIRKW